MLIETEAFPYQTFDAVTLVSTLDMFFGHSEAYTSMAQIVGSRKNSKLGRAGPLGLLENEAKLSGS